MDTPDRERPRIICTVQVEGSGEKTARQLLREHLLRKVRDRTCDAGTGIRPD